MRPRNAVALIVIIGIGGLVAWSRRPAPSPPPAPPATPAPPVSATVVAPPPSDERHALSVLVVDPDGRPVPGATVASEPDAKAVTGPDGTCTLRLDPGSFTLRATDAERVGGPIAVTVTRDAVAPPIVLSRPGTLRGRVVDDTGRPLVVSVDLWDGIEQLTSDADGRFERPRVGEGPVEVSVREPGHVRRVETVFVGEGRVADVTLALTRTAQLEGKILDAKGEPAATVDVHVVVEGVALSTHTGLDGFYFIDVPPGPFSLFARRWAADADVPDRVVTLEGKLAPGERLARDLTLGRGGRLVGRVFDAKGEPIDKAAVEVRVGAHTHLGVSNAEGRYGVDLPPGARGDVAVSEADGMAPPFRVKDVAVDGRKELDLRLPPTGALAGTFGGEETPGKLRIVSAAGGDGRELRGGAFALDDLPTGPTWILGAVRDDARTVVAVGWKRVDVGAGKRLERVVVEPVAPARLAGRVADARGRAVPWVELRLASDDVPVTPTVTTDALGRFRLAELYPVRWCIGSTGPTALAAAKLGVRRVVVPETRVTLEAGQERAVEIVVTAE